LPGSEPLETDAAGSEGAHASEIAAAIEADFRTLVETIAKQMELQEDPDSHAIERLWTAKTVAERGLHLSERLVKIVRDNEASR
jgi:hypothetical protein